jgi:hypothetical protein
LKKRVPIWKRPRFKGENQEQQGSIPRATAATV